MSIQQLAGSNKVDHQILFGSVIVLVGLGMLVYPFVVAVVTAVVLGWLSWLAAASLLVYAFSSGERRGLVLLHVLTAVFVAMTGFIFLALPALGAVSLTATLGVFLLLRAVSEVILGFRIKPAEGGSSLIVNGILVGLIGIMVLASWPASSFWALGTLLAVSVLSNGISRLVLAIGRKQQAAYAF